MFSRANGVHLLSIALASVAIPNWVFMLAGSVMSFGLKVKVNLLTYDSSDSLSSILLPV